MKTLNQHIIDLTLTPMLHAVENLRDHDVVTDVTSERNIAAIVRCYRDDTEITCTAGMTPKCLGGKPYVCISVHDADDPGAVGETYHLEMSDDADAVYLQTGEMVRAVCEKLEDE